MPTVHKHRTNETRHLVTISKPELEAILHEYAVKCAGIDPDSKRTCEVKVQDNMEGSPQYKSGHNAVVIITINHDEEQG